MPISSEIVTLTKNPQIKVVLDMDQSSYTSADLVYGDGFLTASGHDATEASMNLIRTLRRGDAIELTRNTSGNIIRVSLVERAKRD